MTFWCLQKRRGEKEANLFLSLEFRSKTKPKRAQIMSKKYQIKRTRVNMLISRDIKFTPCVCLEGLKRIFEKPFFHHLVTRVLHVHTLKKWRAKQLALTKELPTAMSVLLWHVLSRFFSHVVCFENWPRIQSMKKNTILRGCGYLVFWQFERWWLQPSNQRKLKEGSSTER